MIAHAHCAVLSVLTLLGLTRSAKLTWWPSMVTLGSSTMALSILFFLAMQAVKPAAMGVQHDVVAVTVIVVVEVNL